MPKDPKKILIIDDDPVLIRMLEKVLKMDGYDVISALSGKAGLERAKKEEPFTILLDVLMPDINGKELARQLRSEPKTCDIPIVFLTITLDVAKDKGHETIEVDDIKYPAMAKPMHTRKLLSLLRKEVNKRLHKNDDPLKKLS